MIKNLSVLVLTLFVATSYSHAKKVPGAKEPPVPVTKANLTGKWFVTGAIFRGMYIPLKKDEKTMSYIFTENTVNQVEVGSEDRGQDPMEYNLEGNYITYAGSNDGSGKETKIWKIVRLTKNSIRIAPADIKSCPNCAVEVATRITE